MSQGRPAVSRMNSSQTAPESRELEPGIAHRLGEPRQDLPVGQGQAGRR